MCSEAIRGVNGLDHGLDYLPRTPRKWIVILEIYSELILNSCHFSRAEKSKLASALAHLTRIPFRTLTHGPEATHQERRETPR